MVWPGLRLALQHPSGDDEVIELAASAIGAAVDSCPTACTKVIAEVIAELATAFEAFPSAAILTTFKRHILPIVVNQRNASVTSDAKDPLAFVAVVTATIVALMASEICNEHMKTFAAYFDLLAGVLDATGSLGGETIFESALQTCLSCLRAVDRAVIKAAATFLDKQGRAAGPDELATFNAGLPVVLEHVIMAIAFDADRSVLDKLTNAVESLVQACDPDNFAAALGSVLESMESPSLGDRHTFADVLLQRPFNRPRVLDAIRIFADRARRNS